MAQPSSAVSERRCMVRLSLGVDCPHITFPINTPAVLTGGRKSHVYDQEFVHYAGPLAQDDTRGYRDSLDIVFGELSLELPGLYGPVGLVGGRGRRGNGI